MLLRSINPFSNSVIEEFEEYSEGKLEELLPLAGEAFING